VNQRKNEIEMYKSIISKSISSYFTRNMSEHETGLTFNEINNNEFVKDLECLLAYRQSFLKTKDQKNFEKWWKNKKKTYVKVEIVKPFLEGDMNSFLEKIQSDYYIDLLNHRQGTLLDKFTGKMAAIAGITSVFTLRKSLSLMWTLVVLGPGVQMFNSYTQPVVTPMAQTASQIGAKDLGGAASMVQTWLTNRAKMKEIAKQLHSVSEDLKQVNFEAMDKKRSREKWAEFEDAFFKLFLRYNQTLPSHLRDGRAAFKDFMVLTPIGLASNLATFDTQYWIHRRELQALEEQSRGAIKLNKEDSYYLNLHKKEMNAAESRIAGTLAAWKLYEFMYPEYSRQPTNIQERNHLQNGYRTFVRSMSFDIYVKQFSKQMDAILKEIDGLTIDSEYLKPQRKPAYNSRV
jgi:hypothetical protein